MATIQQQIFEAGLVPVVKLKNASDAVPLARALCRGGLPVAEITFRTDCAAEAIAAITREVPEMLVGAGTVLTAEQADRAVAAGAKFIVSPGLNPKVVAHCKEIGVLVIPGCANPSDLEAAIELGLETVKFFPAEAAGGLAMVKAMSAPYGNLKFLPTGGINEDNMLPYFAFDKVLACGGSFMVKDDLIESGDFDAIEQITRSAVLKMLGFELRHIGINAGDPAEAMRIAERLSILFGIPVKEGRSSIFAGKEYEVMKNPGRGKNGHIAVACNSLERAEAFLRRLGVTFIDETRAFNAKGQESVVYIAEEIGGFAFHLIRK